MGGAKTESGKNRETDDKKRFRKENTEDLQGRAFEFINSAGTEIHLVKSGLKFNFLFDTPG